MENTNRASLAFINRPNPVEPSNLSSNGSLSTTNNHFAKSADGNLLRVLSSSKRTSSGHDGHAEASRSAQTAEVQKSASSIAAVLNDRVDLSSAHAPLRRQLSENDQSLFTLPEPPVKRGVKRPRHRVPPVLQGLHQPPPNAGLLPSINTEKRSAARVAPNEFTVGESCDDVNETCTKNQENVVKRSKALFDHPPKRNKWSAEETETLLRGTARFGIGNWKKILLCQDYSFSNRTANDLRDRFRVCNKTGRKPTLRNTNAQPSDTARSVNPTTETMTADHSPSASSISTTVEFPRSKRRQRTTWTDEEDAAILCGYRRYGASWTSIQLDSLLARRTPGDVRDRFRTRFADDYKKTGLIPKESKPSMRSNLKHKHGNSSASNDKTTTEDNAHSMIAKHYVQSTDVSTEPSRLPTTYHSAVFDDAWLAELHIPIEDDEDADADPIVLDRSIMDWANRNLPSLTSILGPLEIDPGQSVDPLATLVLPKPG